MAPLAILSLCCRDESARHDYSTSTRIHLTQTALDQRKWYALIPSNGWTLSNPTFCATACTLETACPPSQHCAPTLSRASVREALRKLQALDIVTVRQGSGSYVGDMSLQPLVETLILRAALDDINGVQSLHSIVETRHALDLGIALPLTRAMKGTSNLQLWELVTMTDHAHAGGNPTWTRTSRSTRGRSPP